MMIKLFQEKRKKFNGKEIWSSYKSILELIRTNNSFWKHLQENTRNTIDACIRMIGDMIANNEKRKDNDSSRSSIWTGSNEQESSKRDSQINSEKSVMSSNSQFSSSKNEGEKKKEEINLVSDAEKDSNDEKESKFNVNSAQLSANHAIVEIVENVEENISKNQQQEIEETKKDKFSQNDDEHKVNSSCMIWKARYEVEKNKI